MYYVYLKSNGSMVFKTKNKEELTQFDPNKVDVHYTHV